ncbi:hypothetical protein HETIRDRAFT_423213 [Heterobasidion irregulare TC 32-1]|uniref:Uncharacterized protein n=1 Tax=Heterobasidion irregulare (strain TC 32-1) TaxID=747525 RepID=W4JR39_HETIT|nr:uncharacterized protein HETIRDRAFT_423213 [Heterobasidion irregulare TC 32-1]ETW75555.1 hypothetical protein HETIRDRAFT_423213 [Heterobasidion irregulare TC 32-1]
MRAADNRIHSSHSFDNDIVATFMLALLYLCHKSPFLATSTIRLETLAQPGQPFTFYRSFAV